MKHRSKRRVVAVIPARGRSKAIPKKNLMDFCGKKLVVWTIEQALASRLVDEVYVSSDNNEILSVSAAAGAKTIRRPANISGDTSSTEEALLHAICEIEGNGGSVDTVVLLQATSPVRTAADIDGALRKFIKDGADSLFSAAILEDFCAWRLKGGRYTSETYDYRNRGRRQDREPYYLENGSIYISKAAILKNFNNRFGGKISVYCMPLWKSYEIDKPADIEICEYFMKSKVFPGLDREPAIDRGAIKLIIYDCDGVLTDNRVVVFEDGREGVFFNRSDGMAISKFKKQGIPQLILTTEKNNVVDKRAAKLGIPLIKGSQNKRSAVLAYCKKLGIAARGILYVGNDINDLEAMKLVGYPVCPADAAAEVKAVSRIILKSKGGHGVARELLKYIF